MQEYLTGIVKEPGIAREILLMKDEMERIDRRVKELKKFIKDLEKNGIEEELNTLLDQYLTPDEIDRLTKGNDKDLISFCTNIKDLTELFKKRAIALITEDTRDLEIVFTCRHVSLVQIKIVKSTYDKPGKTIMHLITFKFKVKRRLRFPLSPKYFIEVKDLFDIWMNDKYIEF